MVNLSLTVRHRPVQPYVHKEGFNVDIGDVTNFDFARAIFDDVVYFLSYSLALGTVDMKLEVHHDSSFPAQRDARHLSQLLFTFVRML